MDIASPKIDKNKMINQINDQNNYPNKSFYPTLKKTKVYDIGKYRVVIV